jgi:hypothetical protein
MLLVQTALMLLFTGVSPSSQPQRHTHSPPCPLLLPSSSFPPPCSDSLTTLCAIADRSPGTPQSELTRREVALVDRRMPVARLVNGWR